MHDHLASANLEDPWDEILPLGHPFFELYPYPLDEIVASCARELNALERLSIQSRDDADIALRVTQGL